MSASDPSRARVRLLAGAIFLFALSLRLALFTGPSQGDDFAYLEHAYDWAHGNFHPAQLDYVYGLRYGVTLPIAATMKLFGVSPAAVVIAPMLASLVAVVIAMGLGFRLGGGWVGLVAGLFVAVTPLTALSATMVLPEAFLDLALWSSVALAVRAATLRSRSGWLWAGLAGGLAYTVRSYGIVLAVLGALPLWAGAGADAGAPRPPRAAWAWFLVGLAIAPLAELTYHGVTTGDPLFTAHLQASVYADLGNLNNSLLFYPEILARPDWAFGVLPWVVLASTWWALRKTRAARLPAWWLALWFVFLEFSPMSLNPPILIHKEPRYLSVLVLPMGLLVGFGARALYAMAGVRRMVRVAVTAVALLAFAVAIEKGWGTRRELLAKVHKYQAIAERIDHAPPRPIVFPHERWAIRVNYFTGYEDGFRAYAPPRSPHLFEVATPDERPRAGEWVVIDSTFFGREGDWKLAHAPLPEWLERPPASWPERARFDGARIVEVTGDSPASSRR